MSRSVYSLQCKNCGAPLEVHGGGHRVQMLACPYCGSQHDPAQAYAMFAQFSNAYRPETLLQIGMVGKIRDVEFTVIGIVVSTSDIGAQAPYLPHSDEYWAEFLLYSPTHGYLWIGEEQRHFILTRRSRELPKLSMTSLPTAATFGFGDRKYKFYEKYQAKITYVAGELTWVAKAGDRSLLAEGIAAPYGVTYEIRDSEIEYYTSEYLKPETLIADFNLDADPADYGQGIHPLKPFESPILKQLQTTAIPFAAVALASILYLGTDGKVLYSAPYAPTQGASIPFEVKEKSDLVELDLSLGSGFASTQPAITISDETKPVAATRPVVSKWTRLHAGFHLEKPGLHTLSIAPDTTAPASGTVTLKSGAKHTGPLNYMLAIFAFIIALHPIRAAMYRSRIWSKVSGDDEE